MGIASLVVAAACSGTTAAPDSLDEELEDPPITGPRCPVELAEVAAYQSVKVTLGRKDRAVRTRNAELIAGKAALLRVFVAPTTDQPVPDVTVRLTLSAGGQTTQEEAHGTVTAASREEDAASTFAFTLPAEKMTSDADLKIELVAPACADLPRTRFPREERLALTPAQTGTLRVRIVPVRYDADGSGRLPDTSEAQLAAFREALLAIFPVADIELSVRAPLPSSVALAANTGWNTLLDELRGARAQDRTPVDVYDFGLVAPAPNFAKFCGLGCTTGVSFMPTASEAGNRVSVGLGFAGKTAVDVLVHELGHAHGRAHAPCGKPKNLDPNFPYPEALIGVWGYDNRGEDPLRSPMFTRDIMGYCGPRWVSDYTFRALTTRSAEVNRPAAPEVAARIVPAPAPGPRGRTVLVDAAGVARWGRAAESVPPSPPEPAQLLGADGAPLGAVEVHIVATADSDERMYWVPEPPAGAHAIVVPGAAALIVAAQASAP